jgi:hypothetical protein
MLENVMPHLSEQQKRDGAVDRPEFDPDYNVSGWPTLSDPEERLKLERFVLRKCIPERHRFKMANGTDGVVYLDSRGRATHCPITEVPDADLVRMAKEAGKRFKGQKDPKKPKTDKKDHGYKPPVREEQELGEGMEFHVKPQALFSSMKGSVKKLLAARIEIRDLHEKLRRIESDASGVTWTGNYQNPDVSHVADPLYKMDWKIGEAIRGIESLERKMKKMVVKGGR